MSTNYESLQKPAAGTGESTLAVVKYWWDQAQQRAAAKAATMQTQPRATSENNVPSQPAQPR